MKLQKLAYYSQVYSLGWRKKALFSDQVEAWQHGPVAPELYKYHKGLTTVKISQLPQRPDVLSRDEKLVVDSVVDSLGVLSGWELRARTHREKPWLDNYTGAKPRHVIPHKDMIRYFDSL